MMKVNHHTMIEMIDPVIIVSYNGNPIIYILTRAGII